MSQDDSDHSSGEQASSDAGRTSDPGAEQFDIQRRDYMKGVAAAAAAGGLGAAATGTASAETADTSKTVDQRIQEHRTGGLEVVVEDSNGNAVSDADVSITQQDHEFGFGTAVNADTLINQSSAGDDYRTYIPELFNKAVIENQMKWRFWENDQQLADDAVDWLLDQGLDVRGHVCIWGDESTGSIPSDIQTAIDNRDAQTIRDRSMQHIEDIITHYGDDITEWEIVNEAMHKLDLHVGVYGDQIDQEEPWTGEVVPWTSQLLADWYDKAESVIDSNGLDCGIAVNDFNQFAYSYTDGRYQSEIEHINQNAVQLDTIGLQAHVGARTGEYNTNSSPDGRISASQVADEINKWADYGASVKITEFDTYNGNDWNSDQERADTLREYLRGAFSHPGVDDFLMWGFWDGRHWENEAPLFYDDWSQKPGYDVWTGLIYDQWWTDESGTTDSSGTYTTNAYLGEHEITVNGSTTTVTVSDASGTTTVTVTADGSDDGGSGDSEAPTAPSNLAVSGTTSSSVSVDWDASSDSGSGVDSYTVTVDGSQDQSVAAGTTSATVDGLSAGSSYTIGVSAVDGAGNESATTTVSASTDSSSGGTSPDLVAEIDPDTTSPSVGERVAFRVTDTSESDNWIDSLSWTLGNGDTGSGWYTDTTYDSAGSYTVELDATNNEGTTTTDTVTVDVS